MTMSDNDISAKLKLLQESFHKQLPERIIKIRDAWHAFKQDHLNENHKSLLHLIHSLVGTAGTYGAFEVSNTSREIELLLGKFSNVSQTNEKVFFNTLSEKLEKLYQAAGSWEPAFEYSFSPKKVHDSAVKKIFIADDDLLFAKKIKEILENKGYEVEVFLDILSLLQTCNTAEPDAIIMDMVFSTSNSAGSDAVQQLKENYQSINKALPPIVFVSIRDDVDARFKAHLAGAVKYITKPLDEELLVYTLDNLTQRYDDITFNVLIVDDDLDLLQGYIALLEDSNITVKALSDSRQIFTTLADFDADLILMDVNMPYYSGLDVAAMIRKDNTWEQVPIVFLTTESGFDKKLLALGLGGDDYLIKPIAPQHLIEAISARGRRARMMKHAYDALHDALNESEYRRITLDKHAIVSVTDTQGKIIDVNKKFCEISGYSRSELIGNTHRIINSGLHDKNFFMELWDTISSGKVWHGRVCNKTKNGGYYWVDSTIVPFLDANGLPYQYVSARTDITQLIEQQNEILFAKEEAEAANRAKSMFLSNMSHELRTPLNAILGFSQLLEFDIEDMQSKEYLGEISKAGHYLLELINEILDLAKIESGRIQLSVEGVHLKPVFMECLSLINSLAISRKIEINFYNEGKEIDIQKPSEGDYIVRADRVRLKQVLLNLLSNAVKYNKESGRIIVNCDDLGGMIQVSIKDTGIGISEFNQRNLFNSFNRLGLENSGIQGSGIGLVITKNLIELMGGEIGVVSSEGKGSTFWLTLHKENYQAKLPTQISNQTTVQLEHGDVKTIVYIEDNPANLRLVTSLLARFSNINMLTAPEPGLGIEMARIHRPDLVLLDINLPNMNGFDVYQHLQKLPETAGIPVVAISANANPSEIAKATDMGFKYYIAKPIDIHELLLAIKDILNIGVQ